MKTTHNLVRIHIAAVAAGFLSIAAPTVVSADSRTHWQRCPAIDTVPLCDLVAGQNRSRVDRAPVSARTAPSTANDGGDTFEVHCESRLRGPALCAW
jgi:hypothetical protein